MCLSPYFSASVKNVTWILLEILCNFMSQIDGSLVPIDTKYHDYSMSFIQVLFGYPYAQTRNGFYRSSSHGISMAFVNKMMGFPVWIWCHFRPSCRQRDMRKSMSHFLQGCYGLFLHFQFPLSNGICFVKI